MEKNIELEKTYLAKYLPKGVAHSPSREIIDLYFPKEATHPHLRLRRSGNAYELTKKEPLAGTDSSRQLEQTITLTEEEYETLARLPGKRTEKLRYYYPYKNYAAEITIFRGALTGLVLIDFEFSSVAEMERFEMPDFCLAEVTQEDFVAGGMLAGQRYQDIEQHISRYHYKPAFMQERR